MQNIITRTPLRITFTGGGSDLPHFYARSTGAAVNVTIDKYMYIHIHKSFEETYKIKYSKVEEVSDINDIQHTRAREALKLLGIDTGLEITSVADVPSKGTGLASSSAYTVGLLNALHVWKGEIVPKEQLAREAVLIEKDMLKEECGLQDQYAVSIGGLNMYEYMQDESVKRSPIIMRQEHMAALQNNIMLLYTGIQRDANEVLGAIRKKDNFEVLLKRRDMAYAHYNDLIKGDWQRTGYWIAEGWRLKRELSESVTNSEIDRLCDKAISLGADVKNIGAGGGGFLMVFAPPERHELIRNALALREMKFAFESNGTSIVYHD